MITQKMIEVKQALNAEHSRFYTLKSKPAQKRSCEKMQDLRMQLHDLADASLPDFGYADFTNAPFSGVCGGAGCLRGVLPFESIGSTLTVYSADFKEVYGYVNLAEKCMGIEPMDKVKNMVAREPKIIQTFGGKTAKI